MKVKVFIRKKRVGDNSIEEIFKLLLRYMGNEVELVELPYGGASVRSIIKNILFARKNRGAINHVSGEVHYIALGTGRNTVVTVHDIESIITGNRAYRVLKKLLFFKLPLLMARRVTVISSTTKKQLLKICPNVRNKTSVIWNPIDVSSQTDSSQNKGKNKPPIIIHIGTRRHKNLESVMKAIRGMSVKLVVIGEMSQEQLNLKDSLNLEIDNYFNLPYSDVMNWYRTADVVTFPSFYEGFGMPVLEANLTGTPIITSDIDVLHEVAGDAAYFVNPQSVEDIRNGIIKLLEEDELRAKLINNGYNNIKRFAPDYIAGQYRSVYNEIINS